MIRITTLLALALTGCASMSALEEGEPDWVIEYAETDAGELRDCVKARQVRRYEGSASFTEFREGKHYVLARQFVGAHGPAGLHWIANFTPTVATIHGAQYIGGRYGETLPATIHDCL